jgi:hypothetical protein
MNTVSANFQVGNIVDFEGSNYSVYGKIKSIENDKAKIEFTQPNRPKVCEKCGSSRDLSLENGNGQVVCMATGCGYEHGYKIWEEEHPVDALMMAPKEFQS